jgi:hypothetical protein
MNHFIQTLRQLYTVKVDWNGGKYLGMTIDINRQERHVTLSMPGYITKLLRRGAASDHKASKAVHELGSVQSKPTLQELRKMERLLQYVSSHQNYGIRFHASSMQLQIQSDASYSYLCRTKARSVLGGLHFLGTPDLINGPIFCTSKVRWILFSDNSDQRFCTYKARLD